VSIGAPLGRAPREYHKLLLLAPLIALFSIVKLNAQENYEIQVYGSDPVPPGHTMLELHSNFTLQGTKTGQEGVKPTEHAWHETLEITHGFTPWFETGFYVFTSARNGDGWEWVGDHIRPRVAVPASWGWPVGLSLSVEFGYQRPAFSTDTWTIEIRPIIDQKRGRWYWSLNPSLERSLHGASVNQGVVFSPNAKFSYDVLSRRTNGYTKAVSLGLEYYGSMGPLVGWSPVQDQQQQFFPALDLDLSPKWEFNLGVGWGVTRSTDHFIIKMIVGYRFDF
jgi:hypothetical protein